MRTTPPPSVRRLVGPPTVDDVLEIFQGVATPEFVPYGYGKTALRDALRLLDPSSSANVLLPSYLPDGVAEPFREAGVELRFYRVESDLGADLPDVEWKLDGDTAALVATHYFGFPQPRLAELRELCDRHGVALVEDNAHSPVSRRAGQLLGTTGEVGVTSFHKLFAVPNGAGLLVNDATLRRRTGRLELDGVADSYTREDAAYVGTGLLRSTLGGSPSLSLPGTLDWLHGDTDGSRTRDPEAIYRRTKTPMSKLSARVLRRTPRRQVVGRRRQNYRFWLDALDGAAGVEPVYASLPDGVCPQAFPVLLRSVDGLADSLDEWPGLLTPWPPLPDDVQAAGFQTATRLAGRLVRLPVHHRLPETELRRLAAALGGRGDAQSTRPS